MSVHGSGDAFEIKEKKTLVLFVSQLLSLLPLQIEGQVAEKKKCFKRLASLK